MSDTKQGKQKNIAPHHREKTVSLKIRNRTWTHKSPCMRDTWNLENRGYATVGVVAEEFQSLQGERESIYCHPTDIWIRFHLGLICLMHHRFLSISVIIIIIVVVVASSRFAWIFKLLVLLSVKIFIKFVGSTQLSASINYCCFSLSDYSNVPRLWEKGPV